MTKLIFSKTNTQSGFTNVSTLTTNNQDPSVIVREILQNSYDSAMEVEYNNKAKIIFKLSKIDKDKIPSINEYEKAISSIEKEKLTSPEKNILYTIKEELNKDKIDVLFISDDGVGFETEKLVGILSDGISEKSDNSSGSYGNGHFSSFNASNLRYVIYGGKLRDNSFISSGHTILRTFKDKNNDLRSSHGFIITKDAPILPEENIYPKNDQISEILKQELNKIKESGAVVGILGFNYFGEDKDKFSKIIANVVAENFFVAIYKNSLEVTIDESEVGGEKITINKNNLENYIKNLKKDSKQIYYETLTQGEKIKVDTGIGIAELYLNKKFLNGVKIGLCRNGMWITDSIRFTLRKETFASCEPFIDLILPQKSEFQSLIREAEGNLHRDIALNRLTGTKQKKLRSTFEKIKDYILENFDEISDELISIDIDGLEIKNFGDKISKDGVEVKLKTNKK